MLFARIAMRPIPLAIVDMAVQKLARRLCSRYPLIIERLSDLRGTRFVINITDLQYWIEFSFYDNSIKTKTYCKAPETADVSVAGTLVDLINMLDGDVDGDALFFSRNITVDGNTEALLTLRNAIDSEDINLKEDLLALSGVFRVPTRIAFNSLNRIFSRITKDMESISNAITFPLKLQQEALCADNNSLRNKITSLEKIVAKQQKSIEKLATRSTT